MWKRGVIVRVTRGLRAASAAESYVNWDLPDLTEVNARVFRAFKRRRNTRYPVASGCSFIYRFFESNLSQVFVERVDFALRKTFYIKALKLLWNKKQPWFELIEKFFFFCYRWRHYNPKRFVRRSLSTVSKIIVILLRPGNVRFSIRNSGNRFSISWRRIRKLSEFQRRELLSESVRQMFPSGRVSSVGRYLDRLSFHCLG